MSGFSLIIASPAISVVLGLGILANAFISMHANTTVIQKMYSIFNDLIPFNRIYGYYLINYVMTYHAGKDIRIYNQKGLIKEESMSLYKDLTGTLDKLSKNQLKYSGVITVYAVIINSLVYLFVGLKALAGLFGVGSVVRYVGSINEFTNGFISIVSQFSMLRANNEALEVYFSYMSIQSFMNQGTLSIDRQSICKNGFKDQDIVLEFRNVNFKYPSTDSYTLHNISIKIKNGERIAIVGENGSGKTTFIKLLCRLYDPNDGQILLNGTDIRKYDYNDYTSIFSVVFQDFSLFSFSLGQNVASAVEYNKAKVEACLKQVGFGDRLEKMKSGIETCLYKDLDEEGVEISGGEAQKIALARALYKDAPFIILDEPTAALDPIAEYEIYTKFNEFVRDKTAIFISHRLSSCCFCDNIVVFDKGRIVQRGSHDDLLADVNGKYYELWHAQSQYYAESC